VTAFTSRSCKVSRSRMAAPKTTINRMNSGSSRLDRSVRNRTCLQKIMVHFAARSLCTRPGSSRTPLIDHTELAKVRCRNRLAWLFVSERGQPLTRRAVYYLVRSADESVNIGGVHRALFS
jgi:hypothetical protein